MKGTEGEGDRGGELRKLEERFMTAVAERDIGFLEHHLGEEFKLITGRPGHETRDRAEWLEVTAGDYEIRSFRFEELEVLTYGNVALVRSRYSQEARMGDADRSQSYLMTDVWHRREGSFRLVSRHISPLPSGSREVPEEGLEPPTRGL